MDKKLSKSQVIWFSILLAVGTFFIFLAALVVPYGYNTYFVSTPGCTSTTCMGHATNWDSPVDSYNYALLGLTGIPFILLLSFSLLFQSIKKCMTCVTAFFFLLFAIFPIFGSMMVTQITPSYGFFLCTGAAIPLFAIMYLCYNYTPKQSSTKFTHKYQESSKLLKTCPNCNRTGEFANYCWYCGANLMRFFD